MNNLGLSLNTIRSSEELKQIGLIEELDQTLIKYLENTTSITPDVFEKYCTRLSQVNLRMEESVANCLEVINYLKKQKPELPKITAIEVNFALMLTYNILNKLHYFQESLTDLFLERVAFPYDTIPSLQKFSSLKNLFLSMCAFSSTAHDFCPGSLEKLQIAGCPNLIEALDLKSAVNLQELALHYSNLKNLPKNPQNQLKVLHLGLSDVEDFDCRSYVNLTHLKIWACWKIKEEFLKNIPNTVKKLEVSADMEKIELLSGSNLEELSIQNCLQLTILRKIVGDQLKKVNLSKCRRLVEAPDLEECPNLEELNLSKTNVKALPKKLGDKLRKVNLSGCHNLKSIENKRDLKKLFGSSDEPITDLNLADCSGFINSFR